MRWLRVAVKTGGREMRKSIFAIMTTLATLWAGSLVATRAHAMTLGGPFGVRLAVDAIDPIGKADWGVGSGGVYCNDGDRGEADNYAYCYSGSSEYFYYGGRRYHYTRYWRWRGRGYRGRYGFRGRGF